MTKFIEQFDLSFRLTGLLAKYNLASVDDIIHNIDSITKHSDKAMRSELIGLLIKHDVHAIVFMEYCRANPGKKCDHVIVNKVLKTTYNNNWAVEEYVYLTNRELEFKIANSNYTVKEIDGANYHNGETYQSQTRLISPVINGCDDCPLRDDNELDGCHTSHWGSDPRPCDEMKVYVLFEEEGVSND